MGWFHIKFKDTMDVLIDPLTGVCVGLAETGCDQTLYREDVFEEGRMLSSMAEIVGNTLEKPLFDGADSAKQVLCDKLRDNDKTLVDRIKGLAGISNIDIEVKNHARSVALVVCDKAVPKGLKIIKEACANLLYCA